MIYKNKIATSIFCGVLSLNIYSAENMVAKVVILRGVVKEKLKEGTIIDVKDNQDIAEGAIIQTGEKSFVKLIFIDKSQMNLGPSSQMVINAFPKKEAGIITLVKGQLRSQVTKDYMEMDDKSKSKLFIKTNTAAMGIRGTDFQVNFNPENQNTALITFEGAVAMSHIEKNIREERFDQSKLEKVVSNEKAVMVTSGQISAVNLNVSERAMIPTKLAPSQIDALKENETGLKENSKDQDSKKQFRNPIPPGTDGASFSNSHNEVEKAVEKISGSNDVVKLVKEQERASEGKDKNLVKGDPNGFFNDKTGEYKLPAGSIIDLKTVNLIPPPTNAVFDNNTKTFSVPDNFGKVDKSTGEYKAPEGLKLNSDGKFQVVDPESFMKNQMKNDPNKKDDSKAKNDGTASSPGMPGAPGDMRAPASVGGNPMPPLPPNINEIRPDMQNFAANNAPTMNNQPPVMNDQLKNVAQDKITKTETVNQNNANLGTGSTATKVKIIFNAQ